MIVSVDDAYRAVLIGVAGFGSYFGKRAHDEAAHATQQVRDVRVIVNGRSDRMQKRIEELTALLATHGINVPELETSSAEPTEAQQRIQADG
jgi:glycine cleavage system regulatory protein